MKIIHISTSDSGGAGRAALRIHKSLVNISINSELWTNISNSNDLSKLRWTLDYEEDYKFIKKIYEELYIENQIFFMNDILKLLKKYPKLQEINSKYIDHHNIGAPKV